MHLRWFKTICRKRRGQGPNQHVEAPDTSRKRQSLEGERANLVFLEPSEGLDRKSVV